jgi:transposase
VLCPSCGFAGEEGLFAQGCPVCGYNTAKTGGKNSVAPGSSRTAKSPRQEAAALPGWVYVLTVLALAGVLAALFFNI